MVNISMYTASEFRNISEHSNHTELCNQTESCEQNFEEKDDIDDITTNSIVHSQNLNNFKGKFVPTNTIRQQFGALKIFGIFVVRKNQFHCESAEWSDEKYMMEAKKVLFIDGNHLIVPTVSSACHIPDHVLIRLRFLIDFFG